MSNEEKHFFCPRIEGRELECAAAHNGIEPTTLDCMYCSKLQLAHAVNGLTRAIKNVGIGANRE